MIGTPDFKEGLIFENENVRPSSDISPLFNFAKYRWPEFEGWQFRRGFSSKEAK